MNRQEEAEIICEEYNELERLSDENVYREYIRTLGQYDPPKPPKEQYTREQKEFLRNKILKLSNLELSVLHQLYWKNMTIPEVSQNLRRKTRAIEKIRVAAVKNLKRIYQSQFSKYLLRKENQTLTDKAS